MMCLRSVFIYCHTGVVTCLHMDSTGEYLVTGSADTTCKVWRVAKLRTDSQPVQCLYGHDGEVTSVAISTEYDMVVSGSKVRCSHIIIMMLHANLPCKKYYSSNFCKIKKS